MAFGAGGLSQVLANQLYLAGDRATYTLQAYSGAFISRDLEESDKIILPQSILDALLRRFGARPLPSPIIFQLANTKERRASHCGVLEFSSPDANAYLPRWMMENLLAADGEKLQLRLITDLLKATKITFRPSKWSFTKIDHPKAALEYALRGFTCLTEMDTIYIRFAHKKGAEEGPHYLTVVHVEPKSSAKPPHGVTLIDTSVQVEFEAPDEAEPEHEKVRELLMENSLDEQSLKAEQYHYYRYRRNDLSKSIIIQVTAKNGDPDIYASNKTEKPYRGDYVWKGVGLGSSSVTIDVNDPRLTKENTFVWFCVHAYKQEANYSITVTESDGKEEKKQGGLAARIGAASSSSAAPKKLTPEEIEEKKKSGYVQCENCRSWISKGAMVMHSAQCSRLNQWCNQCDGPIKKAEAVTHSHCRICNKVCHIDEVEKHIDMDHGSIPCELCGSKIEGGAQGLEIHKKDKCEMRPKKCWMCEASFPSKELANHQVYCAAKSVQCEICNESVPRKRLEIHKAIAHGINPSMPGGSNPFATPTTSPPLSSLLPQSIAGGRDEGDALLKAIMESSKGAQEQEDALLQQAILASQLESGQKMDIDKTTSSSATSSSSSSTDLRSVLEAARAAKAASNAKKRDDTTCSHCGALGNNADEIAAHMNECQVLAASEGNRNNRSGGGKNNSMDESGYDSFNEQEAEDWGDVQDFDE